MRRHRAVLELVALALLWPLYGPFVLSSDEPATFAKPTLAAEEVAALDARCAQITQRLSEIAELLATEDWDRVAVEHQLAELSGTAGNAELRKSRIVRMEHIERLHFLKNLHTDELDATRALLHQRKAQVQLSRFIDVDDSEAGARLQALRERVLKAEHELVSETELLFLCRES
tara:strand:- start:54964 stop:55485 length:522 start_codon:yes stop_codon:yes gene_type:complete